MKKIKEYIALFKLLQPLGKVRLLMLGIEVFLVLIIAGVGLQAISMIYVMVMILVSAFYVVVVIIDTLSWQVLIVKENKLTMSLM